MHKRWRLRLFGHAIARRETESDPHDAPDAPHRDLRRGRFVLLGFVLVYSLALLVFVWTGRFGFFSKELLLPILLIPPALSRQFRAFTRDWAVFLALIVLFDALRGLIYSVTAYLDLPVYMMYAVRAERFLLGGETLPVLLQSTFFAGIGPFEKLLAVVHASHFVAFLLFGLVIWHWRREEFQRYSIALIILCYAGLLGYFLVPTVPPWMASDNFGVVAPITRTIVATYNTYIPNVSAAFDTNPIAAMPSLHCAIPTLMSLVAIRLFGYRSLPIVGYTIFVFFTVTYGGEHYLVDVLAGILLGVLSYALVYQCRLRLPRRDISSETSHLRLESLSHALVLSGLLFTTTAAVVSSSRALEAGWTPNEDFARRELLGNSPVAHLLLGRGAFLRADFEVAIDQLEQLPRQAGLAEGDRLLAMAYLELGHDAEALRILDSEQSPGPHRTLQMFWRSKILMHYGKLNEAQYTEAISVLEQDDRFGGVELAARLRETYERISIERLAEGSHSS